MKCVNLKMVCVDVKGSGYPNGIDIREIASKGSLYLVESSSKLEKWFPLWGERAHSLKLFCMYDKRFEI